MEATRSYEVKFSKELVEHRCSGNCGSNAIFRNKIGFVVVRHEAGRVAREMVNCKLHFTLNFVLGSLQSMFACGSFWRASNIVDAKILIWFLFSLHLSLQDKPCIHRSATMRVNTTYRG